MWANRDMVQSAPTPVRSIFPPIRVNLCLLQAYWLRVHLPQRKGHRRVLQHHLQPGQHCTQGPYISVYLRICHARMKDRFFREKNRFVTALDLIKCLKQIKLQILLLTCSPISELTSNISSMTVVQYKIRIKSWKKTRTCLWRISLLLTIYTIIYYTI